MTTKLTLLITSLFTSLAMGAAIPSESAAMPKSCNWDSSQKVLACPSNSKDLKASATANDEGKIFLKWSPSTALLTKSYSVIVERCEQEGGCHKMKRVSIPPHLEAYELRDMSAGDYTITVKQTFFDGSFMMSTVSTKS